MRPGHRRSLEPSDDDCERRKMKNTEVVLRCSAIKVYIFHGTRVLEEKREGSHILRTYRTQRQCAKYSSSVCVWFWTRGFADNQSPEIQAAVSPIKTRSTRRNHHTPHTPWLTIRTTWFVHCRVKHCYSSRQRKPNPPVLLVGPLSKRRWTDCPVGSSPSCCRRAFRCKRKTTTWHHLLNVSSPTSCARTGWATRATSSSSLS